MLLWRTNLSDWSSNESSFPTCIGWKLKGTKRVNLSGNWRVWWTTSLDDSPLLAPWPPPWRCLLLLSMLVGLLYTQSLPQYPPCLWHSLWKHRIYWLRVNTVIVECKFKSMHGPSKHSLSTKPRKIPVTSKKKYFTHHQRSKYALNMFNNKSNNHLEITRYCNKFLLSSWSFQETHIILSSSLSISFCNDFKVFHWLIVRAIPLPLTVVYSSVSRR